MNDAFAPVPPRSPAIDDEGFVACAVCDERVRAAAAVLYLADGAFYCATCAEGATP